MEVDTWNTLTKLICHKIYLRIERMAGFFGMEILLYFRIYMRGGGQQFVVSLQVLVWLLSTYDSNSSVIDSDCILVLLSIKFLSED